MRSKDTERVINKGRFAMNPGTGIMWDRKVKGYGTMEFANKVIKRRAKNKIAKKNRRQNRAR